jgi:hypothetical protein
MVEVWQGGGFDSEKAHAEYVTRHTGSTLRRWREEGGFGALLEEAAAMLAHGERELAVDRPQKGGA